MDSRGQTQQLPMLPGTEATIAYPRSSRRPFFAHWYIRCLGDDRIANRIGPEACWLLTQIAITEDRLRYSREVDFYNQQLMQVCGFSSEKTLIAVRKKCIQAGLLHYEGSTKRQAGIYWVIVPLNWSSQWDDYVNISDCQKLQGNRSASDSEFAGKATVNPQGNCQPSSPIPNPDPFPKSTPTNAQSRTEMVDLEKRLVNLGLNLAGETIREAMAHGTTLSRLNAIVDYYETRPGAWEPGALRRRLTLQSAQHMTPDRGWMKADRIAEAREQRSRKSTILVDRQHVTTPAVAKAAVVGLKGTQLEFEFGPILDRMSADDLQRLVAEKKPALMPMLIRYGSGPKWMRASLLGVIATAAEPSR